MKILLSHSGKQHSYQVAKAMNELNVLEKFVTSSYIGSKFLQDYFLKSRDEFWSRRFIDGIYGSKVESNWKFEIQEFLTRKMYGKTVKFQNAVYERDVNFDIYLAKKLHKYDIDTFWGFQGSSLETLKRANELGLTSICELSTAHVGLAKKILKEEQELHPEWASSIDNLEFPKAYEERLFQEPIVAKKVIAASEFTKMSLIQEGIAESKISILPLGADLNKVKFTPKTSKPKGSLKILFAGTLTQRKGIKYLLEAIKKLNDPNIELTCIGNTHGDPNVLIPYREHFKYRSPISQNELFNSYKDFDCLVLPSLFEGFGLVIAEAMAAGLPVIATSHTMAPELIQNEENGFIVPIRSVDALTEVILRMKNMSSEEFFELSTKANQSSESVSWSNYKTNLNNYLSA
jgi:alpha-maltose-1-phosphate synthase